MHFPHLFSPIAMRGRFYLKGGRSPRAASAPSLKPIARRRVGAPSVTIFQNDYRIEIS